MRIARNLKTVYPMEKAISSPFNIEAELSIWCQAHTGAWGQNRRGRDRVEKDWCKMREDLLQRQNHYLHSDTEHALRCEARASTHMLKVVLDLQAIESIIL